MRVLLVEDDPMVGQSLAQALRHLGMAVDWVRDGLDGEEALRQGEHAIALLDLTLPGKPGFDVLKAARAAGNGTPVIVITAREDLDDRVAGLDLGADDYLTKPFSARELAARMRAVVRRQAGAAQSVLEAGELSLDVASRELSFRGTRAVLPAREFALVRALMERPGAILSRDQIETRIYGWGEEVESNAVDVLIHSIRRKFGKGVIRNVRGAGWMVLKASP